MVDELFVLHKMKSSKRIVTRTPVDKLYDEDGELEAHRGRVVTRADLEAILMQYPVEFYVADIGYPLKRIPVEKCHDFWRSEAAHHVAPDPDGGFSLEDFPGEYAYVASEWSGKLQTPIFLLEKHH